MKLSKDSWAILSKDADSCWVGLGSSEWRSKPSQICFYFPDFFLLDKNPYLHFEKVALLSKKEILAKLPKCEASTLAWKQEGREAFEEAFAVLENLEKIVPYVRYHSKQDRDSLSLLNNALCYHMQHPHTTLYGFWDGKEGMVGATPEKLFSKDRNLLQSEAIAGTLPIKQRASLLTDPKLLHEHRLVIEGIIETLAPIASVQIADTIIRDFGSLSHLATPIQAALEKDCSFESLVQVLHPTPALGAYPKSKGKEWLETYNQQVPRFRYGAPCGIVDKERDFAKLYVAIRNVQLFGDTQAIFAGCGIVKGSAFLTEMQEIELKFNAIKSIFKY